MAVGIKHRGTLLNFSKSTEILEDIRGQCQYRKVMGLSPAKHAQNLWPLGLQSQEFEAMTDRDVAFATDKMTPCAKNRGHQSNRYSKSGPESINNSGAT